jgi:hypothetical protein
MKDQSFSNDVNIVSSKKINIKHAHFHNSASKWLLNAVCLVLAFLLGLTLGIDYLPSRRQIENCAGMHSPVNSFVQTPNASAAV